MISWDTFSGFWPVLAMCVGSLALIRLCRVVYRCCYRMRKGQV